MAFPILGEIERLINEKGSAAIMKERLSLAADQYSALEKKLTDANIRREQLESENKSLKLEIQNINTVIDDLRRENETLHDNTLHDKSLEEVEVEILKCITGKPKTDKEISSMLNKNVELIKYHLEELKNINMTKSERVGLGVGDIWYLEQLGRKYLKINNLLNI